MEKTEFKHHWEDVYENKNPNEVSWTQNIPQTSLDLISEFNFPKNASIIDVGGGDSKLVDFLLADGYTNITVLDISKKALEKAKKRLGLKAKNIKWIENNILDFVPKEDYDIWHDRATFHFLTSNQDISKYVSVVSKHVKKRLIIGTFSNKGPLKCSGLEIKQYDKNAIGKLLIRDFKLIKSFYIDHQTPFNTIQNFQFSNLKRVSK